MTQDERNQKYTQVAMKMGDLVFKYDQAAAVVRELEQQMNTLRAEKRTLEEAKVDDAVDLPRTDPV